MKTVGELIAVLQNFPAHTEVSVDGYTLKSAEFEPGNNQIETGPSLQLRLAGNVLRLMNEGITPLSGSISRMLSEKTEEWLKRALDELNSSADIQKYMREKVIELAAAALGDKLLPVRGNHEN